MSLLLLPVCAPFWPRLSRRLYVNTSDREFTRLPLPLIALVLYLYGIDLTLIFRFRLRSWWGGL